MKRKQLRKIYWAAEVKQVVEFSYYNPHASIKMVYMLACLATGRVKIGICGSEKFDARFKSIQATTPAKLEVLAVFFSIGFELEAYLHRLFSRFRQHGEWFELNADFLKELHKFERQSDSSGRRWHKLKNHEQNRNHRSRGSRKTTIALRA